MKHIAFTLTTLLLACGLMAQQPPGPGGMDNRPIPQVTELKTALGLTDDQVAKLVQNQKDRFEANRAGLTQIADKEHTLRETLNAGGAAAAVVGQMVLDIEALKKHVQENDKTFADSARAILKSDQLTKLSTLEDAAKLEPAIRQAIGLNLMQGAQPGAGRGPGGPAGMMLRRGGPGPQ